MDGLTRLKSIPIKVLGEIATDNTAIAKSLLHEIDGMLDALLTSGQTGLLDLRAIPALGEEGYQLLENTLGFGEVSAQLNSFGRSEIREAAISGVWWITHYNQDDEIYTELIEVNFVPDILKSPKDDIVLGKTKLGRLLKSE